MKKALLLLLAVSLIFGAIAITGCETDEVDEEVVDEEIVDEEVEIGEDDIVFAVINSLTGDQALSGTYTGAGIRLAVDKLNEEGGILGRDVVLVFEDDQSSSSGAVTAYQRIVSEYEPDVVFGAIYSVFELAILPYVEEEGIPHLSGATNVKLTHMGVENRFRTRANDGLAASIIAEFAQDEFDAETMAIVHDSDEFGTLGAEMVAIHAEEVLGIDVVVHDAYHTGDRDFSSQLTAIRNADPDVIVGYGHPVEAGMFYRQHQEFGLDMPIIGSPSWGTPAALDQADGGGDGHYAIIDYTREDDSPEVQGFDEMMLEEHGMESDFFASSYHDAVLLAAEAIERAESTDPDAFIDAMRSIRDFEGITGTYDVTGRGDTIHQYRIVQIVGDDAQFYRILESDPWEPSEEEVEMFDLTPLDELPPLWIE